MRKKISLVIILIVLIAIIYNLGKQITEALTSSQRLDKAVEELSSLQDENKRLKRRLSEVKEYEFVEENARNKLNFAKPGETIVVIPPEEISKLLALNRPVIEEKIPNWQGWLKLFVD